MTPSKLISWCVWFCLIASILAFAVGSYTPLTTLNETQVMYLYSTSAQVLAGIYGLTLTGFLFFRNELSREGFEDESLAEAVDILKERYFNLLIIITVFTIITLLVTNLVISIEGHKGTWYKILFMNFGQVLFVGNLIAIAYFIFDVIGPERIERASINLQSQIDPKELRGTRGSLAEFLTNFNQIEYILQKYGQAFQTGITSEYVRPRRIPNPKLAEIILRAEKIDVALYNEIRELITLRNSIVHGAEPVVSEKIVNSSKDILKKLSKVLGIKINEN